MFFIRFISILLLLSLFSATHCSGDDLPFELDPAFSRWHAQVIGVTGTYPLDYKTIASISEPVQSVHNASVTMADDTTYDIKIIAKDSAFGWPDMRIGNEYTDRWPPYELHFYAEQSSAVSQWNVNGVPFEIHGKEKHLIKVQMGRLKYRLGKLMFASADYYNVVRFSDIRLVQPSLMRYYRTQYHFFQEIAAAELVISTSPGFRLYINGAEVIEKGGGGDFDRTYTRVDCTDYLRPGVNTFAVECESLSWKYPYEVEKNFHNKLFIEGIVYYTDGSYERFYTDETWKAVYNTDTHWYQPWYDDTNWPACMSLGSVTQVLSGFGIEGRSFYTNPPYFGPIGIAYPDRKNPFFTVDEHVRFDVSARCTAAEYRRTKMRISISDFIAGTTVAQWSMEPVAWDAGLASFSSTQGDDIELAPGSYLLKAEQVYENEIIDTRYEEFVVIGPIEQHEISTPGFGRVPKTLVDRIDCTALFSSRRMLASPHESLKSNMQGSYVRVRNSPIGKVKETSENGLAWISYAFKVGALFKPHLIKIYYPDDAERTAGVVIHEKPQYKELAYIADGSAVIRVSSGYMTGGAYGASDARNWLTMLYWPNTKSPTITFVNTQHGKRSAVKRIEVYELTDGIPALTIPHDLNQMHIGVMSERADATLAQSFYGGPLRNKFSQNLVNSDFLGYYKAWYVTISNLIKYMRFTGQNAFMPSLYMYYAAHYPSDLVMNTDDDDISLRDRKDYFALLARMFEQNNLSLIPGIEFMGTPQTLNALDTASDRDVRERQAATVRLVSRTGIQAYSRWGDAGLNPTHPRNVEAFFSIIDECIARYKDYPAIKDFILYCGGEFFPSFGSFRQQKNGNVRTALDWGYGDWTIAQFEKDTGSTIPVDAQDPERFSKRYNYLMTDCKAQWIEWRNDRIHTIISAVGEKIRKQRSDWNLIVMPIIPNWDDIIESAGMDTPIGTTLRSAGLDPLQYSEADKADTIVWGPIVLMIGPRWLKCKFGDYNELHRQALLDYNRSKEFTTLFNYSDNNAAFLRCGFLTECVLKTEQPWIWNNAFALAYPTPSGDDILEYFASTVSLITPSTMLLFWTDVTHKFGHEEQSARFCRSYRTLPAVHYRQVYDNDSVSVKAAFYESDYYFCLINTSPDRRSVRITAHDDYRIEILSDSDLGAKVIEEVPESVIHLESFDIQTFCIRNCAQEPRITFEKAL